MKYGGGSFFYRAGHFSITENLWKSDPGVIILYRIVTRGSLYPRVNILYDTGTNPCIGHAEAEHRREEFLSGNIEFKQRREQISPRNKRRIVFALHYSDTRGGGGGGGGGGSGGDGGGGGGGGGGVCDCDCDCVNMTTFGEKITRFLFWLRNMNCNICLHRGSHFGLIYGRLPFVISRK